MHNYDYECCLDCNIPQRKYIFCVYMNQFILLMNVLKDVEVGLGILDVSTISRMTNKFVLRPDRFSACVMSSPIK